MFQLIKDTPRDKPDTFSFIDKLQFKVPMQIKTEFSEHSENQDV